MKHIDKLLHFSLSYAIATFIGLYAFIPAILKEIYDYIKDKKQKRPWRWKDSILDLGADTLGIILAMLWRYILIM